MYILVKLITPFERFIRLSIIPKFFSISISHLVLEQSITVFDSLDLSSSQMNYLPGSHFPFLASLNSTISFKSMTISITKNLVLPLDHSFKLKFVSLVDQERPKQNLKKFRESMIKKTTFTSKQMIYCEMQPIVVLRGNYRSDLWVFVKIFGSQTVGTCEFYQT